MYNTLCWGVGITALIILAIVLIMFVIYVIIDYHRSKKWYDHQMNIFYKKMDYLDEISGCTLENILNKKCSLEMFLTEPNSNQAKPKTIKAYAIINKNGEYLRQYDLNLPLNCASFSDDILDAVLYDKWEIQTVHLRADWSLVPIEMQILEKRKKRN